MIKSTNQNAKTKSKRSLVTFMAQLFQRCTRNIDLVVLAIDDVHLADDLSWKVIQELFEAPANYLLVCTSRPLSQYQLAIDPVFWSALQSDHTSTGKYSAIDLKRLNTSETTEMIAKKLGMPTEFVDGHMQRTIFYQSLGIPQFVNVLLESMQDNDDAFSESMIDEADEGVEEGSESGLNSSENVSWISVRRIVLIVPRTFSYVQNKRRFQPFSVSCFYNGLTDLVALVEIS
jgi:hypothetical protein